VIARLRSAIALVTVVAFGATVAGGCAETNYAARVVARGELTLRYHGAYEMWAAGQKVSQGLGWSGLESYVGCVDAARQHAAEARKAGRAAIGLSAAGGTFGVIALGGLAGFADPDRQWIWLGSGLGLAALGIVLAGSGRAMRNRANGHAIDAMNYYNDSVGSLGATCADLTYPPPAGPAPEAPPPAAPPPESAPPAAPPAP
jgi:hypothetical protein